MKQQKPNVAELVHGHYHKDHPRFSSACILGKEEGPEPISTYKKKLNRLKRRHGISGPLLLFQTISVG